MAQKNKKDGIVQTTLRIPKYLLEHIDNAVEMLDYKNRQDFFLHAIARELKSGKKPGPPPGLQEIRNQFLDAKCKQCGRTITLGEHIYWAPGIAICYNCIHGGSYPLEDYDPICFFLDIVEGKPFCSNPDRPLDLKKRSPTPQQCSKCQYLQFTKKHDLPIEIMKRDQTKQKYEEYLVPKITNDGQAFHEIPEKKVEEHKPSGKNQLIWCPDKDDWIHPVNCDICKAMHFNKWKDCKETRLKNSNDPIFTPTKPKPLGHGN